MRILIPDYEYKSVTEIDTKIFNNKELLIFDIDNTLFYPETTETTDKILKWFKKIKKKHHCICLSNSNTIEERRDTLSKILGVNVFLCKYKKPTTKLFNELHKAYKISPKKMVMIGDMRLTDVRFGNKHNITTILVKPLSKEKLKRIVLAREIENFLVSFIK